MRHERNRKAQSGMSLIAMLVIVILVGGIASAFFLLSQAEERNAEVARSRVKAYYLGEAVVEQVASLLKAAATQGVLPANPLSVQGGAALPMQGTLSVQGYTTTAQWIYQTYNPALSGTQAGWIPYWTWTQTSPPSFAGTWVGGGAQNGGPMPNDWQNVPGQLQSNLRLVLVGTYTIVITPPNQGNITESFMWQATNYQTIQGGAANPGIIAKNYFSINVQGRVLSYDLSTQIGQNRGINVTVNRDVELTNSSLLPFFAFFNNDLEFLPGPAFIGNGKIHTNKDLYLGAGTSLDMNTSYIGASGQMYRHRKDTGSYTENPGPVTIHPPFQTGQIETGKVNGTGVTWSESLESATVTTTTTAATTSTPATTTTTVNPVSTFASQLQSAGLTPPMTPNAAQMTTPPVGSIQPPPGAGQQGGSYYQLASNPPGINGTSNVQTGLVIQISANGTPSATYNNGSGPVQLSSAQMSSFMSSGQIADDRQSQTNSLPTTVIDMKKLQGAGFFPNQGILYMTDARNGASSIDPNTGNLVPPSPPPTLPAGFVIQNGKDLPNPVTVVSNGQVYIQGDFNNPTTGDTQANGQPWPGNPPQPTYAAVIADAVNLLSNAWNNTKTPGSSPPTASNTTYNFAMITGQVPTNAAIGQYSGGLENLPRFLENWSGVTATYRGALINLWTSAIATGAWGQNNVYSPPNRDWDWDQRFGQPGAAANMPGFPPAVSISRTVYTMDYWGASASGGTTKGGGEAYTGNQ